MPQKFTAAAALAAALLLTACGQTASTAQEQADALPELRIASTSDAPYFYMGEDGQYTGIDKEISEEACRRMGYTPVYTVITWGQQRDALENGTVDCVWDCFAMNGREDVYQWAGPYLTDKEQIVVAADSDIQSVGDLAGLTLAVRITSKGEDYFLKEGGTALLADPDTQLCSFDSMADAFAYFGKGYADAVVGHHMTLWAMTEEHPELYRFLDETLMELQVGVAFAKDYDADFVAELTATLDEMNADGTIPAIVAAYDHEFGEAGAADGE